MPLRMQRAAALLSATAVLLGGTCAGAATFGSWETVANNTYLVPGGTDETFFSYNPPSISAGGEVFFRGRARPPQGGGPVIRGIYGRDMSAPGQPIEMIADTETSQVPDPNNTGAGFNEFPSFPRVDRQGNVAFRGQHPPVWQYVDPDGNDTRTGTTGVYGTAAGPLSTGASQLGLIPAFDYFSVPGSAPAGTRFDQFPGAPSPDGAIVTFKGNWTDAAGVGRTGVYFRDMVAAGGQSPVHMIAESGMEIPGLPGQVFGSTAPPSASRGKVVFTGLDNEDAPTAGGIYVADILPGAFISPLVTIGAQVPDAAPGESFNRIGEALSFDGRSVAFWGAWGSETREITLTCPTEGNQARIEFCIEQSGGDGEVQEDVPVNQGIFRVDIASGDVETVAATGDDGILDFLFWNFSGRVPGDDDEDDGHPARWRSSAFMGVENDMTVFKATDYETDWLKLGLAGIGGTDTILATGMAAWILDPMAPAGSWITELGIERDGLRGGRLAISASFLNDLEESWAGLYVAAVPLPGGLPALGAGLAALAALRRRRATV